MTTEAEIQRDVLNYLNLLPNIFAWKQATTGTYDPRAGIFRKLSGFSIKGVSDILGFVSPNGRGLAIEVKKPGGKVSPEQNAFLSKVKRMGGIAGVVYSLDDAILLIEKELYK